MTSCASRREKRKFAMMHQNNIRVLIAVCVCNLQCIPAMLVARVHPHFHRKTLCNEIWFGKKGLPSDVLIVICRKLIEFNFTSLGRL